MRLFSPFWVLVPFPFPGTHCHQHHHLEIQTENSFVLSFLFSFPSFSVPSSSSILHLGSVGVFVTSHAPPIPWQLTATTMIFFGLGSALIWWWQWIHSRTHVAWLLFLLYSSSTKFDPPLFLYLIQKMVMSPPLSGPACHVQSEWLLNYRCLNPQP